MSIPPEYEQTLFDDDSVAMQAEPVKKKAAKKKVAAKKKAAAKKKTAKKKAAAKKKPEATDEAVAVEEEAAAKAASKKRAMKAKVEAAEPVPVEAVGTTAKAPAAEPVTLEVPGSGGDAPPAWDGHQGDERRSRRGYRSKGRHRDRNRDRNRKRDRDRDGAAAEADFERRPRKEIELGPPTEGGGLVELSPKGFGFLRQADRNFYQTNRDTFIPPDMVRDYGLRNGMVLKGEVRRGPRGPQCTAIHTINDRDPSEYQNLPVFEELTAVNPSKRWILETDTKPHTTRIMDMITPVGRGQRGLIVAPPRTGKTTLLEHIAQALDKNHPNTKVILLLVDERPEEVTELTRALPNAEIMASSNDNDTHTHMRVAQLAIERAKRMVEAGEDVFILLDSITRLARAFNRANKGKGGLNKGGLSNRALEIPRRLFAAARNTREAGSLTILATALIETGTMMDEAIFQEFKGTGNLELVLDKSIAQHYVYPAVDIFKSGTRREELLLPPHQIEKIYFIRRGLSGHKPIEAIERLLSFVERFPNNAQMLLEIKASVADG